jgi:hypothetical protein
MKRKNEESKESTGPTKKRALSDKEIKACFGKDVFAGLENYTQQYAKSLPYGLSTLPN